MQEIVQHDAQNSDAFQQMIIGLGEHLTRKNDGEVSGGEWRSELLELSGLLSLQGSIIVHFVTQESALWLKFG